MKILKMIPRGNQVLVRPDDEESRVSESGLVKPSNIEQEQKAIGTVIAVGAEVKDIKKGDRVIYGVYAGDPINFEEVDYKFVEDKFILGFIK